MMLAFDTPIPFNAMGRRNVSNVPAQALILMNDPFVVRQAELWAGLLVGNRVATPRQRIQEMYLTALARPPSREELDDALRFLVQQAEALDLPPDGRVDDRRVWADLCHVLMNAKEFIFRN